MGCIWLENGTEEFEGKCERMIVKPELVTDKIVLSCNITNEYGMSQPAMNKRLRVEGNLSFKKYWLNTELIENTT